LSDLPAVLEISGWG